MFKLVVGLGNPGETYVNTRHNVGSRVVREIAAKYGCDFKMQNKFSSELASLKLDGKEIKLLIPNTFMNLSGSSVAAVANFYRIELADILVIHDELDLGVGDIRLKNGGGAGGHNGLKDIISKLGNQQNFWRVRIGIGHPGHSALVSSYVLAKPSGSERDNIDAGIIRLMQVMPRILTDTDMSQVMQILHTKI